MATKRTTPRVVPSSRRPGQASPAAAVILLLALAVAVPLAQGHHEGGASDTAYATHYMVKGRVVNETGWPLPDVQVNATLFQYGSSVWTDCRGEFEAAIQVHQAVSSADVVTVTATLGSESRSQTLDAHPVTRRSDTVVILPGDMPSECTGDRSVQVWEYRYTVAGRVVDERGAHEVDGVPVGGGPVTDKRVEMTFYTTNPNGSKSWHIPLTGGVLRTDANGDFEYSYVLKDEQDGGYKITPETYGYIEVMVQTVGVIANLTEPSFPGRYIYVNGAFGALPADDGASNVMPAAGLLAVLGAVAGAAVAGAWGGRRRGGGGA